MVAIDGRIDLSQYQLSTQQKDALKKAKTPDQVVEAIGGDGTASPEEQKLIDEIVQELTASTDGTLKFKDGDFEAARGVAFGKTGNFRDTVTQKVERVMRQTLSQSTFQRDRLLDRVQTVADARRVLSLDSAQANSFRNDRFTAGKILLQDTGMLTRMGLVKPADQAYLNGLLNNVSNKRLNAITPADITRLKEIVAGASQILDGMPDANQVPPRFRLNEAALTEPNNFAGLNDNFDALVSSGEAAVNDANLAVGESGLNREQMRTQNANGVQGGASFSRINSTIREADRQLGNLNRAEGILQTQITELGAEIERQTAAVTSRGEDPSTDSNLNSLKASLQTNVSRLQQITNQRGQLASTKIHTLQKAKEFGVIVNEFDKRMLAIQSAQSTLSRGCQTLEHLNKWATGLAQGADQMASDEHAPLYLQAAKGGLGKVLEMTRQTTDDMANSVNQLLNTYKASPTANAKAVELLGKELETLRTLRSQLNGDNVKDKIQELTAVRTRIIAAMQPMVAEGTIDPRELRALTVLDESVNTFTGSAGRTGGDIEAYIGNIDGMIQEAKSEKTVMEKQSSKSFEMIKKFSQGNFLAYGSHVGANLNVTVGVGNQYAGIGAGITAGFKIEKTLAGDPNRELQMSVNVGVMAEAHAGFGKLFSLDAEFKASLQAGLAFATVEDAQNFMQNLADGVKAMTDNNPELAQAKIQEMKDIIAGKGFTGTIVSGKVQMTAASGHSHGVLTGKKETSTKNYGDGATGVERQLSIGGKFEWAHGKEIGVKYAERETTFTDKAGHVRKEGTQTVSVAMPLHMIEQALSKVKLGKGHLGEHLDEGAQKALVDALGQFGFDTSLFAGIKHGANLDKIEDVIRTAKLKGESEVMIGFERHFGPNAQGVMEAHDFFEIGLEGEYKAEMTATSGSAYARVKGEASYELAAKIPAPHFPVWIPGSLLDMPATDEHSTSTGGGH